MYQKCQQLRKLRRVMVEKEREWRVTTKKWNRLRAEVAEYISSVPDPYMRKILHFRYIDDMRWNDIVTEVGGSNNEDSLRKMCFRYLSKQNVRFCDKNDDKVKEKDNETDR